MSQAYKISQTIGQAIMDICDWLKLEHSTSTKFRFHGPIFAACVFFVRIQKISNVVVVLEL